MLLKKILFWNTCYNNDKKFTIKAEPFKSNLIFKKEVKIIYFDRFFTEKLHLGLTEKRIHVIFAAQTRYTKNKSYFFPLFAIISTPF